MPTLASLYNSKIKKFNENMENQINMDVLQALNSNDPLSNQEEKEEQVSVLVPNGEKVSFTDLPPEVQTMFSKVKIHAMDKNRQPSEFKPAGYAYSLIYKQDQPIDFSGGWCMNTHNIEGEEYFMSMNDVDDKGMNLFYKLNGKQNQNQVV
mgnify:CR=1 FL=1